MNKGFGEDIDPMSSIAASDTIEFLCAANSDVYTDLANSYLHVKAKITNAIGSNLAGTASGAASVIIGGGGRIFILSCSALLTSFEIDCFYGL